MNSHMREIESFVRSLPVTASTDSWTQLPTQGLGGATVAGFAPDSDLLLVESPNGKGLFNCLTEEKVAREYEDHSTWLEGVGLVALGIGPTKGQQIRMAGIHGGGLCLQTLDGWMLEEFHHEWPERWSLVVSNKGSCIYSPNRRQQCSRVIENHAPRVFGFSFTGRSFIVMYSHSLFMWARKE